MGCVRAYDQLQILAKKKKQEDKCEDAKYEVLGIMWSENSSLEHGAPPLTFSLFQPFFVVVLSLSGHLPLVALQKLTSN